MHTLIVHLMSDDPFVAEVEEIPQPTDNAVVLKNPRMRDGKQLEPMTVDALADRLSQEAKLPL